MSEMSLKGGADPTEACTVNPIKAEEKVSQMKYIIIGRKQWIKGIKAKREKNQGFNTRANFKHGTKG